VDVFEYVAKRVVERWEYEEQQEARKLHFREASTAAETIRLIGLARGEKALGGCCGL